MINSEEQSGGWAARAPKGWGPVAQVCRAVHDNLTIVTKRINAEIEQTIPDFAPPDSPFTPDDRFRSTRGMIAGFLHAVAENRAINDRESGFARLVGQRSAIKGFPLPPLIDSLYTAYREIWATLVEEADRSGGRAGALLRDAGATIWERMHATTTAVTAGYHQQMPRPEALEIRIANRFVKAIGAAADSDECRSLGIDLGFNPEGTFAIATLAEPASSVEAARRIAAAVQRDGAVAVAASRTGMSVLIVQNVDAAALEAVVVREAGDAPAGIGAMCDGIPGLKAGLAQAESALRLAEIAGGVRSFGSEWFLAAPMMMRDGLEQLFAGSISLARRKPHLADAVASFARHGFSLAAASLDLAVTQSTVRYRLKRWHALTGWDAWTFGGLANSIMALELARAPQQRA